MPEITQATVEKIARLANIRLGQEEAGQYAKQLEHVLEYIHKLNELDTHGIPETVHALPLKNIWRLDEVQTGLSQDQALDQAPEAQEGCFRVPRIME